MKISVSLTVDGTEVIYDIYAEEDGEIYVDATMTMGVVVSDDSFELSYSYDIDKIAFSEYQYAEGEFGFSFKVS